MSNGGGVGVGTSRSPVLDTVAPRSPRPQPDVVDIERQPMLETTQLEVANWLHALCLRQRADENARVVVLLARLHLPDSIHCCMQVPARGRMLKSSSVIFGGGPISFTFPTWIMTLTIIISWCAAVCLLFWNAGWSNAARGAPSGSNLQHLTERHRTRCHLALAGTRPTRGC